MKISLNLESSQIQKKFESQEHCSRLLYSTSDHMNHLILMLFSIAIVMFQLCLSWLSYWGEFVLYRILWAICPDSAVGSARVSLSRIREVDPHSRHSDQIFSTLGMKLCVLQLNFFHYQCFVILKYQKYHINKYSVLYYQQNILRSNKHG